MVIRQWMRKINFFPLVFGGLSPAKKKILLLPLVLLQSGFLAETWEREFTYCKISSNRAALLPAVPGEYPKDRRMAEASRV